MSADQHCSVNLKVKISDQQPIGYKKDQKLAWAAVLKTNEKSESFDVQVDNEKKIYVLLQRDPQKPPLQVGQKSSQFPQCKATKHMSHPIISRKASVTNIFEINK